MKFLLKLLLLSLVSLFTSACTMTDGKQIGYSMLENLRQQQCQKAMQYECQQKPNFNAYQQQRQEVTQ